MLNKLCVTDFQPLLNQVFSVQVDASRFDLTLIEAKETNQYDDDERNPFSLIFEMDGDQYFEQGTFTLEHPAMDELAVFMVPLGREARGRRGEVTSGFRYQVIFN